MLPFCFYDGGFSFGSRRIVVPLDGDSSQIWAWVVTVKPVYWQTLEGQSNEDFKENMSLFQRNGVLLKLKLKLGDGEIAQVPSNTAKCLEEISPCFH